MARFLVFIFFAACFLALFWSRKFYYIHRARRTGLYPLPGKGTMFDVRSLIKRGEVDLAIQLYCEIFNTNHSEASRCVYELAKSVQSKDADGESTEET